MSDNLDASMERELEALRNLAMDDEELILPDEEEEEQPSWIYENYLVGFFLTNKSYNFKVMKNRMATVWQPGRGLHVQDLGDGLILFRFFHEKDFRWIADRGEFPTKEGLVHANFWVQVSNLCSGLISEATAKALGNFIGEFISYDEWAAIITGGSIMRFRARLDVREPLKKEKRIKEPRGEVLMEKFRYERLPNFCFICGRVGHIDRHCEIYFRLPDNKIIREWDITLRAPPLKTSSLEGDKWLIEEAVADSSKNLPLHEVAVNVRRTLPGQTNACSLT
ncbi:hypothetical protein LINPERHAP1_LOCUS10356 [Linum perenne]